MKRVLIVGKGAPEKGGIASFLDLIMMSSLRHSFDLRFLNLARPLGEELGRLSVANIKRTLEDMIEVFRGSRLADVVHLHTAFVPAVTIGRAGLLTFAARAGGSRVIVHVHGGLFPDWLDTGGSAGLVRLALWPASRVIAVSAAVRDRLEAIVGVNRLELIVNGIETTQFVPMRRPVEEPPTIGFVGFLTRRKGLLDLFDASRLLTTARIAHRIVVVGGTPTEGDKEGDEIRSAAPATVEMVGAVDRDAMSRYYTSFDVFCLPSWWEAAPLSVLEAMSSGLAVVATRVGDIPTMVEEATTGLLVAPRDPTALAAALATLLADRDLMRSMGTAGRAKAVAEFDSEATVSEIARLYGEVS